MIRFTSLALLALSAVRLEAAIVVDFEALGATLGPDTAYVGADLAGGFTTDGATFSNSYNPTFNSWAGNAYSNRTSFDSGGFVEYNDNNDTAVVPTTGAGGSDTWLIANSFLPNTAVIEAPSGAFFESMYVTNARVTDYVIDLGNGFSEPFGGASGNDPDLFTVRFNDLSPGGGFVEFVLADYRFADNTMDYIVDDWQLVDLSSLGGATRIGIEFTSTDSGGAGINTPTYVAIDDITFGTTAVPEPGALGGLAMLSGAFLWHWRRRRQGKSANETATAI